VWRRGSPDFHVDRADTAKPQANLFPTLAATTSVIVSVIGFLPVFADQTTLARPII